MTTIRMSVLLERAYLHRRDLALHKTPVPLVDERVPLHKTAQRPPR